MDDLLFPMEDERLDFAAGLWTQNDTHIVKTVMEDGRVFESRKPVLSSNYIHLCSVALKPYKFGLIDTKIRIKLRTGSG